MKLKFKPLFFTTAMIVSSLLSNAQQIDKAQNIDINKSTQGGIVNLPGFLTEKFTQIDYSKMILPGPQYIMSDDPEYIRVPEAIALREKVAPGSVRFYLYNVNGVVEPQKIDRKITAVIKNTGNSIMHIRMLKYSSQKPSTNYFKIGKEGLADYFNSTGSENIRTVKPGEAILIDEELEKHVVKYDELVHGFYEFVIDQPGEITVLQTDLKTKSVDALKRITNILPSKSKSGAGRGLYGVSNYQITGKEVIDTKNGVSQLMIADGKTDPWILGKEGTMGSESKLAGNYGVMYNIDLKWKSTDGKGLALVTWNSRSGDNKWCSGMAASMVVNKGKFDGGVIQLPKDQLVTKGAPEAIVVQIFPPAKNGEEQTIHLTYSPPGASCLPTPLVFIPIDMKP